MSGLGPVYLDMVDDLYHRRDHDRLASYVAHDYVVVDPHFDRGTGPHGLKLFHSAIVAEFEDVHYDTVDLVDNGKAVATRFVVTARRAGKNIAFRGISINHGRAGKLTGGFVIADYRAIERPVDAPLLPAAMARWDGNPILSAPPSSHLATYLAFVDALYKRRDVTVAASYLHPRFLAHDPVVPRGSGDGASQVGLNHRLLDALAEIDFRALDAVEVGDKLATRFVIHGRDQAGKAVAIPGISIVHFEDGRLRRGWVQCSYGSLGA